MPLPNDRISVEARRVEMPASPLRATADTMLEEMTPTDEIQKYRGAVTMSLGRCSQLVPSGHHTSGDTGSRSPRLSRRRPLRLATSRSVAHIRDGTRFAGDASVGPA